jgi:hypothetical protein
MDNFKLTVGSMVNIKLTISRVQPAVSEAARVGAVSCERASVKNYAATGVLLCSLWSLLLALTVKPLVVKFSAISARAKLSAVL